MADTQTNVDNYSLNQGRTFPWHEIYAANSAATIEFYTQALDFGTETMNMGMGDYKMLTRNGIPVCGVMGTSEMPDMANVPPHWATYISVDDVDARLAKCQEMGASLMVGPMDVPTVGRMVLIKDPQGAVVWLFQPKPM